MKLLKRRTIRAFTRDGLSPHPDTLVLIAAGFVRSDPLGSGGLVAGGSTVYPTIPAVFSDLTPATAALYPGRVYTIAALRGAAYRSDGVRWRPYGNLQLIGALGADIVLSGITEQIAYQLPLPAGVWQDNDRMLLRCTAGKSGTSETATFTLRLGSTGTASDAALFSAALIGAANQSFGFLTDYKRKTATSVQKMGNGSFGTGYNGGSTATIPAAVTVPSLDSVLQYLTASWTMSAAVELLTTADFEVWHAS